MGSPIDQGDSFGAVDMRYNKLVSTPWLLLSSHLGLGDTASHVQ